MNVSAAERSTGMPRSLGSGRRAVFEKSDRRETGQPGDLVGHVGLVGIAGVEGELDERGARVAGGPVGAWGGERLQAAKAQDAREQLRAVADRVGHAALQLAGAEPELVGYRGNARAGPVEGGDGSANQWVGSGDPPQPNRAHEDRMGIAAGP